MANQRINVRDVERRLVKKVVNKRARSTLRKLKRATPEDKGELKSSLHIVRNFRGRAVAYRWESAYASFALRRRRVWRRILNALN